MPVSWGTVLFLPKRTSDSNGLSGKAAAGPVDERGHYRLSTYSAHDGAIVGSHAVRFIYEYEDDEIGDRVKEFFGKLGSKPPKSFQPGVKSVDVLPGENVIDIELIRR
jgi:hypothetical protein